MAAIVLLIAGCGGKSDKNAGTSNPETSVVSGKITPPDRPNIVRYDSPSGTFFIECDEYDPRNRVGIALYNSSGKFLLRFEGGLTYWSGNTGLVYKNVSVISTAEWWMFSFKTLEKKYVGNFAEFIKKGNFIRTRDGFTTKLWNLEGELIWEGQNLVEIVFKNDLSKDFWIILNFTSPPAIWLNLATGETVPWENDNIPQVGGDEVFD